MSDDNKVPPCCERCAFIFGVIVAATVAGFIIIILGASWRMDAIDHGFARYDAQTGAWEWKQ